MRSNSAINVVGRILIVGITLPSQIGVYLPAAPVQKGLKQTLQHEVSVVLKLFPVHVVDKAGKPVADLTKDDFRLTDNGSPVVISAFERHDLAATPGGVEPPVTGANRNPGAPPARVLNRKFVLLFDFAFNTGYGIVASVAAARNFIQKHVEPTDEIAFISFSMLRGLRVHEFLTTDHSKILAALSGITSKEIVGRADEIEQAIG